MLPGLSPVPIFGDHALVLTKVHDAYDTSNTGAFSFAGCNFGPAASDRLIIGVISYRRNSALGISGVTIGGVSATVHAGTATSTDDTFIFSALVPSGTSGTVAMTMNSAGASLVLYRLTGQVSNTPVFSQYITSGSPLSATQSIGNRTAVVASAVAGTAATGFAGTASLTQDYARSPAATTGDMLHRAASRVTTSNLGSVTVQHGANGASKMALVGWQ